LLASLRASGRAMPIKDSLIAATARRGEAQETTPGSDGEWVDDADAGPLASDKIHLALPENARFTKS
jgi:hypothetical protein